MLSYIKKIISGDSEFYQIKFQGETYNLYDVETTQIFLIKIKEMLKKEMTLNEYKRDYLEEQLALIENLQNHLACRLRGVSLENDIFAEEYYKKEVDFLNKLKLKVGFKPKTSNEYSIYKGLKENKLDKIEDSKRKIEVQKDSIPDDIKIASLNLKQGSIDSIYVSRLKKLSNENVILTRDKLSKKADFNYERNSLELDATIEAMRSEDVYSGKPIGDVREAIIEENMSKNFKYKKACLDYFNATLKQKTAEQQFTNLYIQKGKEKRKIIRELLEYRYLLEQENKLENQRKNIAKSLQSYSRTYR